MTNLRLRLILSSKEINNFTDVDTDAKIFWLEEDVNDTKSTFSMAIPSDNVNTNNAHDSRIVSINRPCHLFIDCCAPSASNSECFEEWKYSCITVISNSRNIELYAAVQGNERNNTDTCIKEHYWQTHRGILLCDQSCENAKVTMALGHQQKWYKTVLLPPNSNPTDVIRLHLKLLSLQPSKCVVGSINNLELNGLLPQDHVIPPTSLSINQQNPTNTTKTLVHSSDTGNISLKNSMMEGNINNTSKQCVSARNQVCQNSFTAEQKLHIRMTHLEQNMLDLKNIVNELVDELKENSKIQQQILKQLTIILKENKCK